MQTVDGYISYSIAVFVIVLIAACVVNLLNRHFIFQLIGIAFFFTCFVWKILLFARNSRNITVEKVLFQSLPLFSGISACLIGMVLGFWIFPVIRKKIP